MRRLFLASVLSLACLSSTALNADTLRTFALEDKSGQPPDGIHSATSTLSGSITIDVTTGQALYGYLQYSLSQSELGQPFDPPLTMQLLSNATNYSCITPGLDCMNFPDSHQIFFQSANQDGSTFSAMVSTPTSLVDYMGGDLCYMSGCDPNALTYFIYQNFTFPPYTIDGTPFPGGTITGMTSFGTGEMVLVSEATTPEPATWVLLSSGALGLIGSMKRRLHL